MTRAINISLPQPPSEKMGLVVRNLAILLQAKLLISVNQARGDVVLSHGGTEVCIPFPILDVWDENLPSLFEWRGTQLPQVNPINDEFPDILGLIYYVFFDVEEIRQQAGSGQQRFDINQSLYREIYKDNYLDQVLLELKKRLGLPERADCGLVLTHDLDFLSVQPVADLKPHINAVWTAFRALRPTAFLRALKGLVSARFSQPFEFLNWATCEEKMGYRSIFFVLTHDRDRSNPADGTYDWDRRNPLFPFHTLRWHLRRLARRGHVIGPHLSRSSNYSAEQIAREYSSFRREMGMKKISSVRNHWLWFEYRNWHDYLRRFGVEFDFNVYANGYPKGTAYPYFAKNDGFSVMVSTTFADDAILKKKNMSFNEEQALDLLSQKLQRLKAYGGCMAISFHPAEDIGELNVADKLALYQKALLLIQKSAIPVYLPSQVRARFVEKYIVET